MTTVFETLFTDHGWDMLSSTHGQTVTYTPTAGDAVSRTGLFVEETSSLEYGEDGSGEGGEAMLTVRNSASAGVASPAVGDTVTVGGETWKVAEISTSGAVHRLRLRKWTPDEKGSESWRRRRF